jgi:hypothetical protein
VGLFSDEVHVNSYTKLHSHSHTLTSSAVTARGSKKSEKMVALRSRKQKIQEKSVCKKGARYAMPKTRRNTAKPHTKGQPFRKENRKRATSIDGEVSYAQTRVGRRRDSDLDLVEQLGAGYLQRVIDLHHDYSALPVNKRHVANVDDLLAKANAKSVGKVPVVGGKVQFAPRWKKPKAGLKGTAAGLKTGWLISSCLANRTANDAALRHYLVVADCLVKKNIECKHLRVVALDRVVGAESFSTAKLGRSRIPRLTKLEKLKAAGYTDEEIEEQLQISQSILKTSSNNSYAYGASRGY